MIYYKPVTDENEIAALFPSESAEGSDSVGAYVGYDSDGSAVGKCCVKIDGYSCFILSLECDFSDKLLTEGFVRAALNFSANRSAYMAYCRLCGIADVLLSLGFEKDEDGVYSGDIPTLLKGSCCK